MYSNILMSTLNNILVSLKYIWWLILISLQVKRSIFLWSRVYGGDTLGNMFKSIQPRGKFQERISLFVFMLITHLDTPFTVELSHYFFHRPEVGLERVLYYSGYQHAHGGSSRTSRPPERFPPTDRALDFTIWKHDEQNWNNRRRNRWNMHMI